MRATWMAMLTTALMMGCVYDDNLVYDDPPAPGVAEPGPAPPSAEAPLRLHPAGGVPGDILIASVVTDGTWDLRRVESVEIFGEGDILVLAIADRGSNELLLTLDVQPGSAASDNHVLVTFFGGETVFLEDAFVVAGDPLEVPTSIAPDACL